MNCKSGIFSKPISEQIRYLILQYIALGKRYFLIFMMNENKNPTAFKVKFAPAGAVPTYQRIWKLTYILKHSLSTDWLIDSDAEYASVRFALILNALENNF